MKTTWKDEWAQWMVLAAMFGLAAWRWPLTGDHIPVHWNASGIIDRYGSKAEGLLFLPLISLGLYVLLWGVPRLDPGRANYAQFVRPYRAMRLATLILMLVIYGVMLAAAAGRPINMSGVILAVSGFLLMVIGNAMGKIRPNWFTGIRTPWTLSSKVTWVKTHRIGGWTFIALGAGQIAGAIAFPPAFALSLAAALLLLASVGLSAYSYLIWRDAGDKTPPANTLPAD